jgi:apolipoprotein D and lipocalin family protein
MLAHTLSSPSAFRVLQNMQHRRWNITGGLLAMLLLSSACTGVPEGVRTVRMFELDRYLGTWYEIARLDHKFERGLSSVTATYSMRDGGGVKVVNRGFDTEKNEWDEAEGKAFFTGDPDVGELKASFFGPFYGGYNIIELDKAGYEYSMVAGPDKSYLWILARSPELEPGTKADLVSKAAALGFPTNEFIFVEHAQPAQ